MGLPFFSIHGNHDDPSGDGQLCSLDILSAANLVNYFGKSTKIDDIDIRPVLLRKGETKVCLFGLGNIRDERLHRTFLNGKVRFPRPEDDADEWFNLFTIHQNRVRHSATNYIPESFLPNFLDLIVWGHEHPCEIQPSVVEEKETYITQPGSTIATSLSEGESKDKHVGILKINKKQFNIEKVSLTTVRPFLIKQVVLEDMGLDPTRQDLVEAMLKEKVEQMIEEVTKKYAECENRSKMSPLIRLKVEYTGFSSFNTQRFGQPFVNKVANPKDILAFFRKRKYYNPGSKTKGDSSDADLNANRAGPAMHAPMQLTSSRVEDLIKKLLNKEDLQVLKKRSLEKAVLQFIDKGDKDAIKEMVEWQIRETSKQLIQRKGGDGDPAADHPASPADSSDRGLDDDSDRSAGAAPTGARGGLKDKQTASRAVQGAAAKRAQKRAKRAYSDDSDVDANYVAASSDYEIDEISSTVSSRRSAGLRRAAVGATSRFWQCSECVLEMEHMLLNPVV